MGSRHDKRRSWMPGALSSAKNALLRVLQSPDDAAEVEGTRRVEDPSAWPPKAEALVGILAWQALSGKQLSEVMEEAASQLVQALGVDYSEVLELLPSKEMLVLVAGSGWKAGCVGSARVSASAKTQAGWALASGGPVIVSGFRKIRRFRTPALHQKHRVVSGVSVPISTESAPFGVLSVHSKTRRSFTTHDVDCVQAVAQVLARATLLQRTAETPACAHAPSRSLFDHAPDVQICVEPETGTILRCNDAVHSSLGYLPDEVVGRPIVEFCARDDQERVSKMIRTPQDSRAVRDMDLEARRKDGSTIAVSVSGSIILDQRGRPSTILLVCRDISARKHAERMLLSQQTRLRASAYEVALAEERERQGIAAGLHGEIGQLLATAALQARELLDALPPSPLHTKAQGLGELVDQAARAARGATFELNAPVLHQLGLEAALQSLGERMEHRYGVPVLFETDRQPAPVTDEARIVIFQVVRDLLLDVPRRAPARGVRVSLLRVGNRLQVSVDGDFGGAGTVHLGGAGRQEGLGLFGLSTQIAGLGGSLEIRHPPGSGSLVIVSLPVVRQLMAPVEHEFGGGGVVALGSPALPPGETAWTVPEPKPHL